MGLVSGRVACIEGGEQPKADGSEQDFSKDDVMLLPPGHDAWTVGTEPCIFVEFSRGNDYYAPVT